LDGEFNPPPPPPGKTRSASFLLLALFISVLSNSAALKLLLA
jgi:hypothetical protein